MLPVDVLKNLYGSLRTRPWVTNFSHAAVNAANPMLFLPAEQCHQCLHLKKASFWGTSMACPQVAEQQQYYLVQQNISTTK